MNLDKLHIISTRYCGNKHISYSTILGMENEFEEFGNCEITYFDNSVFWINKILNKLFNFTLVDRKLVKRLRYNDNPVLFVSMDYRDLLVFKKSLKKLRENLVLYVFDCWEPQWGKYQKIFNDINPYAICFAYKKSAEHFDNLGEWKSLFIPQSMDSKMFKPHDKEVKDRLFMQMGRRTECLHELVTNYLQFHKIDNTEDNYVYERERGKVIFPSTEELAREISKTYFFMVAPQNIENHAHTGDISEVTARFYEAMASKSLCVGIKPEDSFDELFPYENAMIDINEVDFSSTIEGLMADHNAYNNLVNRNYDYVMENHCWKNRYEQIMKSL